MDEKEISKKLQELSLQPVPPELTGKIMAAVSGRKERFFKRLISRLFSPLTVQIRPIYILGSVVGVLLLFVAGFLRSPAEKHIVENSENFGSSSIIKVHTPKSAFLAGRALLELHEDDSQALAFLKLAARQDPDNPEYAYWEGVGYWRNGDSVQERLSYQRGLAVDPRYLPILINLGHSYLAEKRYTEALQLYKKVTALSPEEGTAWYNSGLIYRKLGRFRDASYCWKMYLKNNRLGAQAFRAVGRLNEEGDFSYRAYQIGPRRVILDQDALLGDLSDNPEALQELSTLRTILALNRKLKLEIVVFLSDTGQARQQAYELKKMIIAENNRETAERIRLSWFNQPERVEMSGGRTIEQAQGILFFGYTDPEVREEVSI